MTQRPIQPAIGPGTAFCIMSSLLPVTDHVSQSHLN